MFNTKAIYVADYVITQAIGALAPTEAWLGTDTDQLTINEFAPTGYGFNHIPRKGGRCGGRVDIL